MREVLEGGSGRGPVPAWAWALAALLVAAAATGYVLTREDVPGPGAAPADTPPPGEEVPSAAPDSSFPAEPWRTAEPGSCGRTPLRPRASYEFRPGPRGAALVGGHGVRLVDLRTGKATRVSGVPATDRRQVDTLVRSGGTVYALSSPCRGPGQVYRLARDGSGFVGREVPTRPADQLVAGPDGVWTVRYASTDLDDPPRRPIARTLRSGRVVQLPTGAWVVSAAADGLVVARQGTEGARHPPALVVLGPEGRTVRTLGRGRPVATSSTRLLRTDTPRRCRLGAETDGSCVLALVDVATGEVTDRFRLPPGRVPHLGGALRDGDTAVFRLAQARQSRPDVRGHPLTPTDVTVLRLDDGGQRIVPGLELAPKSPLGLALGPGPGWVLATTDEGDHSHVLAWRPGARLPRESARLDGLLDGAPPVLPVGGG